MESIVGSIDIGQLADLTSQIATIGALRLSDVAGHVLVSDQIFEFTVGMVAVVQSVSG